MADPRIDDVLTFWFGAPDEDAAAKQKRWFAPDPAFDAEIRTKYGALIEAAARGDLTGWPATPRGALALVIVLDQFPRNAFRKTAGAFAHDPLALDVARGAVADGHDRELSFTERTMLYMPYMHAEDRDTQRESVAAFEALHAEAVAAGAPEARALASAADFARRHAAVIERFGRYPHRNAILERTSTGEEVEYLSQPGAGF